MEELSYEAALAELTAIVQSLERSDKSLAESAKDFERGLYLSRYCQQQLQTLEERLSILTADGTEEKLEV